ncbi:HigA family addiction module antitoxin [Corynebacterium sp. H130]|uniref:HigA family addiction module antitoxin n=1 Tax=Corynebacterium sp. H130 TaxID=3133444 RepID=UPI0030B13A3D
MFAPKPPHPGEVFLAEFLNKVGINVTEAARRLGISRVALHRVIQGQASMTPRLAIKLETAGAGTAQQWLEMQNSHDLAILRQGEKPKVERII